MMGSITIKGNYQIIYLYLEGYGRENNGDMGLGRVLSNGTLHISPITEKNSGVFVCEASNDVGPGISAKVVLDVYGE